MLIELLFRAQVARRMRALERSDPDTEQRNALTGIVKAAATTRFGREHRFRTVRTPEEFRAAVPLRSFAQHLDEYWSARLPRIAGETWPAQPIAFIFGGSGAPGGPRHVPITRALALSMSRGVRDLLAFHLAAHPRSSILRGGGLLLGDATSGAEYPPDIRGAAPLAHRLAEYFPRALRRKMYPPIEIARIKNRQERFAAIAAAVRTRDIRWIAGTPAAIRYLAQTVERASGESWKLTDWFPNLELLAHTDSGAELHGRELDRLLEGSRCERRELHVTSEGVYAVQDSPIAGELRLLLGNGIYFELIPLAEADTPDPPRLTLADAEIGGRYTLVVSSCAGLWACPTGTIIELISKLPPRIRVLGSIHHVLSLFGERIPSRVVERAVAAAAAAIGITISELTVAAARNGSRSGVYRLVLETPQPSELRAAAPSFAEQLDRALGDASPEFRELREESKLACPTVVIASPGSFEAWASTKTAAGVHRAIPLLIWGASGSMFEEFLHFVGEDRVDPG